MGQIAQGDSWGGSGTALSYGCPRSNSVQLERVRRSDGVLFPLNLAVTHALSDTVFCTEMQMIFNYL